MNGYDANAPAGAGTTDPLLAELRAARPEPPPEVLSPRSEPNRALVQEILMTATVATADSPTPRRGARRRRVGLLAGAAAASAVAVGAVVVAPWGTDESAADALVRDTVVATQAALADTGRATTTVVTTQQGERSDRHVTLLEFAGDDERYRPATGGYDNRLVDGDNYVQGFDDRHPERWYRVLCNAGAERATPDPRTLADALTPQADFEIVGDGVVGGVPTTHLRAGDPDAVPADVLVGPAEGPSATTALDIWVDGDDVTRRVDTTVETTLEGIDDGSGEEVTRTDSIDWSVEFSDLGEDIVIAAPTQFEDETCDGA